MLKKKKRRRISARIFLRKVSRSFAMIGLSKITNNREKEMGAKPPKVRKPFEGMNQLSLEKPIRYDTIRVRTSVDEKGGCFNETGRVRVLVISARPGIGEEIVFYRSFQRRTGVEEKVIKLVTALDLELSSRPSDSKGKFMNLVEVSPRRTVWRSPNFKRNKEEKEMFLKLPSFLADFICKEQYKWEYYQKVVRKRKGIKRYESQVRKKWYIANPENAVPVR